MHVGHQRQQHNQLGLVDAGAVVQQIHHLVHGAIGRCVERLGGRDDAEVRAVLDKRINQVQVGQRSERDRSVAGHLGARHANLAIAHRRVHVAVAAGRSAVHRIARRSHADDADHGVERDGQLVVPH